MADRDDDDDDRYDDRPRRRPRPKSKTGLILLIIFGVLGVTFLACGTGLYFYIKAVMDVVQAPQKFLDQVRAGDYQGAYASTSSAYKATHTLQQFTDAMKAAKLDQNTGLVGQPASRRTGQKSMDITSQVGVPGKSTTVTWTMVQEGGPTTFVIDDITGPDIPSNGVPKIKW